MKEKKIDLYDLFPDSGLVRQYKPFIIPRNQEIHAKVLADDKGAVALCRANSP
jgi:hypothetical protein